MISFCARGTRSSGISRPRSPRATITASHASRISSRCSSACGRSSFATSGTSGDAGLRHHLAGRAADRRPICTKLTATRSTPSDSPKRRSSASFGVIADAGRCTPGAVMPLCSPSAPAVDDGRLNLAGRRSPSTRSSISPSASSRRSPGGRSARGHRMSWRRGPGRRCRRRWRSSAVRRRAARSAGRLRACRSGSSDRRDPAESPPPGRRAAPRRGRARYVARVRLVRAVREIQPDDVDARGDERVEHRVGVARRSDGGDDLGVPHSQSVIGD